MLVFVVTKNIRRYCGLFRLSGLREGVAITGLKAHSSLYSHCGKAEVVL